jgi:ABC-2 type transport system permease protein
MQYSLKIYLRLISIQIRSQWQYRTSFWLDLVTTGLVNGSYFFTLALVISRFGSIGGWSLEEVAFLIGLAEISFGLMDLVFSGYDPSAFSPLVRLGRFDQFLLRPVNIMVQVFGSRFMLRRLGRVLEGILILAYSLATTPILWTVGKVIYLPVVIISQAVALGALFLMGSTLTFWTIQPIEAVNIVTYGGNEAMSYPMHIYPDWLQKVFTYMVPFIFMNYYPALYFLDKPDPLHFPAFAPFMAPLAAALMFLLAEWFWRFGLAHYQSSGS